MYFIELSDWDFRRQNAWFYQLSHKKSDKLLKFTLFKILKIGLDKLLFKKKKIRNKCGNLKNGAAGKNRTCDPVITNDVLYH